MSNSNPSADNSSIIELQKLNDTTSAPIMPNPMLQAVHFCPPTESDKINNKLKKSKMKKYILIALVSASLMLQSCSENYSNGERIGVITQFSKTGAIWKSHEGHLNVTQTGMNSSVPFDFSIDNDHEEETLVKTIDSAAQFGWKVKLVYHETCGKNWFSNRGSTDHFIEKCEVLEKNFGNVFNGKSQNANQLVTGKVIDTIYVVIDRSK